jgi:arsenate reductase
MGAVVTLYHNPKCSKSRAALEILQQRGIEHEIVAYLETPPGQGELETLLDKLGVEPAELLRRDAHFDELGLRAEDCTERDAVIEILLAHPRLLQRPLAVRGGRAVIGRPPERVLELLD